MEPRGDGFLLTEILTTKRFCSLSEDQKVQKNFKLRQCGERGHLKSWKTLLRRLNLEIEELETSKETVTTERDLKKL